MGAVQKESTEGEAMTRLLCLLALAGLLGVGTAGAEGAMSQNYDDHVFQYTADGYLKVTKESLDALLRDYPDAHVQVMPVDPCLAKMEAAMRAYDKFVNYGLTPGKPEDIQERAQAIVLWDKTIKDCWTK